MLLLCDGSIRDARKLEILDIYCTTTRMKVNVGNSKVLFLGNDDESEWFLTQPFSFNWTLGWFEIPFLLFKYQLLLYKILGLPCG
jgi:hypothetical protein